MIDVKLRLYWILLISVVISVTSLLLYGAKQGFLSGTLAWAYIIAWLAPVFLIMALICSCFLLKSQSARTHGDKRPILQHSISVDSSHLSPAMCMRSMKKSSPRPISPVTTRERSGSELRARATSVTALMQNTPPERCPDRCDATHAMWFWICRYHWDNIAWHFRLCCTKNSQQILQNYSTWSFSMALFYGVPIYVLPTSSVPMD